MKKFRDWLNSEMGLATRLTEALTKELGHTVNATCISNVKSEKRLMPCGWMPTVHKLSGKEITVEYLVVERNKLKKKLNKKAT